MKISALFFVTLLVINLTSAQTPAPVVVQAATSPPASATVQPAESEASREAALQAMQALKATNDELLKKQTATMQKLDELQKAAEQLKIYSKRG